MSSAEDVRRAWRRQTDDRPSYDARVSSQAARALSWHGGRLAYPTMLRRLRVSIGIGLLAVLAANDGHTQVSVTRKVGAPQDLPNRSAAAEDRAQSTRSSTTAAGGPGAARLAAAAKAGSPELQADRVAAARQALEERLRRAQPTGQATEGRPKGNEPQLSVARRQAAEGTVHGDEIARRLRAAREALEARIAARHTSDGAKPATLRQQVRPSGPVRPSTTESPRARAPSDRQGSSEAIGERERRSKERPLPPDRRSDD